MSEPITHEKRSSTYAEGKRAFDQGKRREDNPYAEHNETLALIWFNGWDMAKQESQGKGISWLDERD